MRLTGIYMYYIQKLAPIDSPEVFYKFIRKWKIHLMAPLIGEHHKITYLS